MIGSPYLAIAALLVAAGLGAWGGYAVGHRQALKLARAETAEELAELAATNKANDELAKLLGQAADRNGELEGKLREALATVPREGKERIVFREVQRDSNPTCRAWLDALVPCRLHPDPAGDSHAPGTRP